MARSIVVSINGQKLSVRTDAKSAYVKQLAQYVGQKMEEVRANSRVVTNQSLALMAAMAIADELHQDRDQLRKLQRDVRDRSKRILEYIDRSLEDEISQ